MDHIDVAADQTLAMDAIADGVHGLRITFVNVFALSHPDGRWTLVDAGIPLSEGIIRKWAEKTFAQPPNSIVLTHGHFDHVSAARALADEWNVPIFAHELELPYLTGKREYPAPDTKAGGGLMTLLSPIYPRGPVDLGLRLQPFPGGFSSSDGFDKLPGWKILHTPGHTPGHVSFFRQQDKTLLVGDAFCTTKPESFFEASLIQHPELHGPPSYFTWDWDLARQSVQQLAKLRPMIVAPGHGKPLAGSTVAQELQSLADNFETIAVPDSRR